MISHDTCDFCGAEAWSWHGDIAYCRAPRCIQLEKWATHEPQFRLWMDPTPMQRVLAVIPWALFRIMECIVPVRWLLDDERGTWREAVAVWVYGNEYHWAERREGRI